MVKSRSLAVRALFSVTALIITSPAIADSPGSSLYERAAKNEVNGYARVIELQHAGDINGKLLATWEHWYANTTTMDFNSFNGTAGNFIIRQSDKAGGNWTTVATVHDPQTSPGHPSRYFYQPFLFEFPQQLGKYPAGTILLVGNLCNGTHTQFFSWRSQTHGMFWDPVGPWQHGGATYAGGGGIWEPFLYLDSQGRLIAVFSDERNRPDHGQIIAHLVSTDGGDTWDQETYTQDVVSSRCKDRPGMATVAKMDNGEYFMSYEVCTDVNYNCTVHGKTSPDGINWNKTDVGNPIVTADGITLWASPYTVWDPFTKQLVLASMNQFLEHTAKVDAPEIRRSVFTNKDHGKGEWFWSPSPSAVPSGTNCTSNRSPNLLPLSNGVIQYTTQSPKDAGFCSEQTGKALIGVLPYTANFSLDGQAGLIDLGGDWSISGDQYSFASTTKTAAVAVTGSSGWTDYKINADVMISSKSGDIGLSARVSALESGLNHLKKYTAVISSATGNLTVYRAANVSTPLHSWALPGGIEAGKWYHLSFAVRSDHLTVTFSGSNISYKATDDTFPRGMVGLYGNNGSGGFKNVHITSLS